MAGMLKGITVEIGGDTTKLSDAISQVNSKIKDLQKELKGVNTLLKLDPTNTKLLYQKQQLLANAIGETETKLNALRQAEAQMQQKVKEGKITIDQYRDFQREVEATEIKLKDLTKELKNFGSVGAQQVAAVGEKMKTVGDKISEVGSKLKGLSMAAAGVLTGITKEAIDFETAWTGVTKTVDGSEEQLAKIKQGILDMSQETASSAEDIAAVAESAGQLGIKTDDILDFTKTMVMLGDSTNLSADEASSALAKFANITGMSADDYGRLGSVIVDLGNNFATTEADIVAMGTRLASTGEITGLSESQILALAASLSSAGIEAEAGGSAMAKLLKNLFSANAGFDTAQGIIEKTGYSMRDLQLMSSLDSKAFKDLAGELGLTTSELNDYIGNVDMMNKYASTAGVSVEEFRKAYGEDAVGALSMFITGLNNTEQNGKSAVETLNEMGLTEVRLSNAVLAMASSGDLMTSAIETANNAWGENTALTTEAEKRYQTTAAQLSQLKGSLTELSVSLGSVLLPIVQNVVDKLKQFADWLTNLSPGAQKVVLAILAFTAALAPVLIIIGKVISAVGQIMQFAPQIMNFINLIKSGITGLFSLITAHPIIAIITAVVAAVVLLYNKCEWFRNAVNAIWDAVVTWCVNAFQKVVDFFTITVPNAINTLVTWFQSLPGRISAGLTSFGQSVSTAFNNVKTTVTNIAQSIYQSLPLGFQLMIQNVQRIIQSLVSIFQNIFNIIKTTVQTAISVIKAIFTGNFQAIPGIVSEALEKIRGFFANILDAVATIIINWIALAINYFRGMGQQLWSVFQSIGQTVSSTWQNIRTTMTTAVQNTITAVVTFFQQLPGKIYTAISTAISKVTTWGNNMRNAARTAITNTVNAAINLAKTLPGKIWDAIVSAVDKVKSWGAQLISAAKEAVGGLIDSVVGLLASLPGKFVEAGRNIVNGLKQGISNAMTGAYESIKGAANGLVGKAKEALGIKSPSRVFRDQVGEQIPAGIAEGVKNGARIANGAVQNMSDDLVKQASMFNGATIDRQLSTTFGNATSASATETAGLLNKLDAIYQRLDRLQIVLDTGALVGETIDKIDAGLTRKQLLSARGV